MSNKINYVCIVCSTTFTRKSSAFRHSVHIHAGTTFFVRLIDYIVGRTQGRYQPSNPLLYRQKKRNEKNLRNLHSMISCKNAAAANKIPASRFTVLLDETKKDQYNRINSANESRESDLKRDTQKVSDEFLEWTRKYQELTTFVRKYHTEEDASRILSKIKGLYLEGKDNLIEIDKWLERFRIIDRNRRP
jgi:hypothetical protein